MYSCSAQLGMELNIVAFPVPFPFRVPVPVPVGICKAILSSEILALFPDPACPNPAAVKKDPFLQLKEVRKHGNEAEKHGNEAEKHGNEAEKHGNEAEKHRE